MNMNDQNATSVAMQNFKADIRLIQTRVENVTQKIEEWFARNSLIIIEMAGQAPFRMTPRTFNRWSAQCKAGISQLAESKLDIVGYGSAANEQNDDDGSYSAYLDENGDEQNVEPSTEAVILNAFETLSELELVLSVDPDSDDGKNSEQTATWFILKIAKLHWITSQLFLAMPSLVWKDTNPNDTKKTRYLSGLVDQGYMRGFEKKIALNQYATLNRKLKEAESEKQKLLANIREAGEQAETISAELKTSMNDAYENIEKLKGVDDHFKNANEKIDGYLKNASQAGLAASFTKRRQRLEIASYVWGGVFLAGIIGMTLATTLEIASLPALINDDKLNVNALLTRCLLAAPLFWLTWFAVRQYGNSARLIEDYAFKESSALAYHGYKEECKDDSEALNSLRKIAVENFGTNPTRMLPGQEAASPLHELLEGALKKEGFDKIVTVLNALNPKAKDDSAAKKDDKKDDKKEE